MSQKPPSLARITLLLIGSMIAGMLVSSLLISRLETRRDRPLPLPERSLVVEGL